MREDITRLGSRRLAALYGEKKLSPVEVAQATLRKIDQYRDMNAFSVFNPEETLAMARASEARWMRGEPLGPGDGIPVTIKDVFLTAGWSTLNGSRTSDTNQDWSIDSPCSARLREEGCVFVGKTSTSEFGWKGVNDSPLHGPTRNPWHRELTSGGSSGGSGVAAALDLGVWHAATDAAGSIRIPAAFCGVFGFKPTYGVAPLYPHSVFSGLTHYGAIAPSISEIDALMAIISRFDPRDPMAAAPNGVRFGNTAAGDAAAAVAGKKIAYLRDRSIAIEPEIAAHVDEAARVFERLGAIVEELVLDFSAAREAIDVIWRVGCHMRVEEIPAPQRALVDPGLVATAKLGVGISATELRRAQLKALDASHDIQMVLTGHDFLLMPTVPVAPLPVNCDTPPGSRMTSWLDWSPFTYPFNLSHNPAIAMPAGLTQAGLPTSCQLVGRRFDDPSLLQAAAAFEAALPPARVSASP